MAWEHGYIASTKGITTQKESSKKPVIALLLPHTGNLNTEFVERIWGALRFTPVEWCDKIPIFCKVPSLPVARNTLARKALDNPSVTHLFWIDSDHVLEEPVNPNEALEKLHGCNVPIVAGIYRAKQKIGFYYAAWTKVQDQTKSKGYGYTPIGGWTGNWITVDAIGLGFCLVKREVFEKVPEPWFHWDEEDAPSEDFYFCEKAIKAGYEVKILTDVKLSHIGELKVKIDGSVSTLDV